MFGGWFTANSIVPIDTLVNKKAKLDINQNDPHFDRAFVRTNKMYTKDLNQRLEEYSFVCKTVRVRLAIDYEPIVLYAPSMLTACDQSHRVPLNANFLF